MTRINRISDALDACINFAKWPVAIASVLATFPSVLLFIRLATAIFSSRQTLAMEMVGGFFAYGCLWWLLLKRTRISFFSTLEHELTHTVFALLTFHRVTGIRSSLSGGGQMTFQGKGNWLITISPYFFPAATVFLCGCLSIFPGALSKNAGSFLGASMGYHVISTWNETHKGQSDLKRVGFLFASLFLPFANFTTVGFCLSWFNSGVPNIFEYLTSIFNETAIFWKLQLGP